MSTRALCHNLMLRWNVLILCQSFYTGTTVFRKENIIGVGRIAAVQSNDNLTAPQTHRNMYRETQVWRQTQQL